MVDYKDWQIVLNRRFRSVKLWMVLRSYGVANLRSFIRNHIKMAENFEALIGKDRRFEVVVPRNLSTIVFRVSPAGTKFSGGDEEANAFNAKLLESINGSGRVFMTHSVIGGAYVIRIAIGATLTENRHINMAWKVVQEHADALLVKESAN